MKNERFVITNKDNVEISFTLLKNLKGDVNISIQTDNGIKEIVLCEKEYENLAMHFKGVSVEFILASRFFEAEIKTVNSMQDKEHNAYNVMLRRKFGRYSLRELLVKESFCMAREFILLSGSIEHQDAEKG